MPAQDVLQVAMALCNQRAGGRFDDVCRPMVSTAKPAAVRMSAQQLRAKLLVLVNLLTQLQACRDGLMKVWSSQSAATANTALTNAFATFQKTIDATTTFIQELERSADKLDMAMDGANQAVDRSEPSIAAFLANPQPASQQAARAMAVGTTAQTNGFLSGQRAALTASAGSINGGVLGGLASILNGINQLMGGGQASPTTTTAALPAATIPVTTSATALPTVTLPNATLPTATPPFTGLPSTDQTYPYGYPTAASTITPTTMPTVMPTTMPAVMPTDPGGHVVQVAFNPDGSLAGVQSDIPVDVRVDEMTAGGQHLVRDIRVNADGSTTTTTT
jgi:hypothetical protein